MPRYLIQQPNTPEGLYGTFTSESEPEIGDVREMPIQGERTEEWVVTAIEPSPMEGYAALIVFAVALSIAETHE